MKNYDVIIIGAGIQGLSAAYNICLEKNKSVLVIESDSKPGNGSTSKSGSMLMKSRENKIKILLSLYSYNRLKNFKEEFHEELIFEKTGFLSLVTKPLEQRYLHEHKLRQELGLPSKILNKNEIKKLSPGVSTEGISFGVLGEDDGVISPEQLLNAYKNMGQKLGVEFSFNEEAIDIIVENKQVIAVKTTKRTISCKTVVNAAGANAKEVASWINIDLPIDNRLRSLYIVETFNKKFQQGPMVEDAELEFYYRPISKNKILIGMGKLKTKTPSDKPNYEFLPEIKKAIAFRIPELTDFVIIGGSSGLRSLTPDILPIVGPVQDIKGFITSCGWGGEGIMHSPAGGALVADWINNTNYFPLDKNIFLLERFL